MLLLLSAAAAPAVATVTPTTPTTPARPPVAVQFLGLNITRAHARHLYLSPVADDKRFIFETGFCPNKKISVITSYGNSQPYSYSKSTNDLLHRRRGHIESPTQIAIRRALLLYFDGGDHPE
jgi:hypothetical protein